MKVLVISHMYPSKVNSTYGIFVRNGVLALKDQGVEIKVISPVPNTPFPLKYIKEKWHNYASIPFRDIVDGIEVFYPRYTEFPRSFLLEHSGYFMYRGIKKVVKELYKDFPFDLVHAHVAVPDGHSAVLIKAEYNVPAVVTIHGQDLQTTIVRNKESSERVFSVLNKADRVITVSGKLKNVIKDEVLKRNTLVINNGISIVDCIREGNAHDTESNDDINIVSVSNLKKTKGIDLNLKALYPLINKYPNIKYYIVGDGEERANLMSLAESLGIAQNVFFLGKLPHREALKYMANSYLFSLPSWQEGFGVVYIEAMAHGKPVIGVRGEGIEDVIVHGVNGFLVSPHSAEDLRRVLDFLINNPLKAKAIGEEGRKTVINGYTWSKNAEKTVRMYKELLESAGK